MSVPYVTGAAYLYVGIGPGFKPVFLGTAEFKPRIRVQRKWGQVFNDVGGDEPFDWQYLGSAALVSVVLTKWNEAVAGRCAIMPNAGRGLGQEGIEFDGDIGTLMLTENLAFPLWVRYPYGAGQFAAKPAMVANALRGGRRFFRSFLLGPDDEEPGTRHFKKTFNFYCMRDYNTSNRRFGLFDANMAGLPLPD